MGIFILCAGSEKEMFLMERKNIQLTFKKEGKTYSLLCETGHNEIMHR